MILNRKNIRVLIVEPSNQHPRHEKARPNGSLAPAYLVGALRKKGIEADLFGCYRRTDWKRS